MCDMCENPLKWYIDERDVLLVPVADISADAPVIDGWKQYETNYNYFDPSDSGIAKTFLYRQPTPTFFVVGYDVSQHWGGPEEGGWHYYREEQQGDPITVVKGERHFAESVCRSLNRIARRKHKEEWGSYSNQPQRQFTIDRWPGESDNSRDPRPHYC